MVQFHQIEYDIFFIGVHPFFYPYYTDMLFVVDNVTPIYNFYVMYKTPTVLLVINVLDLISIYVSISSII